MPEGPSTACNDPRVTFDLAFWEGPRPETDQAAMRIYDELFPEDDELEAPEPPSDAIRSLITELERRWPPFDESSPWAVAPLGEEDAQGPTLYVNLVFGRSDEDLEDMADIARRLGVVCFDPQTETVL